MSFLYRYFCQGFDLLVGKVCPLCHEEVASQDVCDLCLENFVRSVHICPVCADLSLNAQVCGQCQTKRPYFTAIHASYDLTELLRGILHTYKYQKNMQLCGMLSQLMLMKPPKFDLNQIDAVLAVPLSSERFFKRGFNQSYLLAQTIARFIERPLLPESMIFRVKKMPQVGLKYKQRQENIKNSFVFSRKLPIKGKNILLIDDVATTGATLNELAKSLKKQGVQHIFAWVLAKKIIKNVD
ncbi:ComF family protein [Neisseria sp. Ec49-e6-T10]|uniref:ComF family protein n=1 Tax=Neisseria sp. Ec49-e6-T10 TaxID=3140744 RepID=UPI003EB695FB